MAITWENTIKGYLAPYARCMQGIQPQLDLASYDSVKDNAVLIYQRLTDKDRPMPPKTSGGPWPQNKIDSFRSWVEAGSPES